MAEFHGRLRDLPSAELHFRAVRLLETLHDRFVEENQHDLAFHVKEALDHLETIIKKVAGEG